MSGQMVTVKVKVVDGARDRDWIEQRLVLLAHNFTHCRECLTTVPPDGQWIDVTLSAETESFCSWECLLINMAAMCLHGDEDHPQIKVKRP